MSGWTKFRSQDYWGRTELEKIKTVRQPGTFRELQWS